MDGRGDTRELGREGAVGMIRWGAQEEEEDMG